mmetsp:Transcript_95379/g.165657  ORF Transcript_95379/g.165657 Transcript_95379/m.165657 type:complete len:276 (+) Transcript_95379:71-898(+)
MPFDLPAGVASAGSAAAWAKALNYRDFQDKQLRVIQYSSRSIAGWILKDDSRNRFGLVCNAVYKQLSLSRKAFRFLRSFADLHAALNQYRAVCMDRDVTSLLGILHWALMAVHIFWDNMMFCTHPSVGVVDRWSNDVANQCQKNWRAAADTMGLMAAWLKHRRAVIQCASASLADVQKEDAISQASKKQADSAVPLHLALSRRREAWYAMVKLLADVLTYLPQTSWCGILQWTQAHGWHDGHIGIAGSLAALVSCRSEWIKIAKSDTPAMMRQRS